MLYGIAESYSTLWLEIDCVLYVQVCLASWSETILGLDDSFCVRLLVMACKYVPAAVFLVWMRCRLLTLVLAYVSWYDVY